MEFGLKGRHVAILAADGVDGALLGGPRRALDEAGAAVTTVGSRRGPVQVVNGDALRVDETLDVCHAADFDALVIPGGRQATEALAAEQRAVQLVREFMAADKPVAAIGDGVRLLMAADAIAGRVVAAPAALAADVRRAGGELADAPVHVDEKLLTASGEGEGQGEPTRLTATMMREFANRVDEARVDQLSEQSFPASDPPPGPVAVGGEGASAARHLDPRPADHEPDRGGAEERP
jgi:protease I